jgi:cytochrome c
MEQALPGPQWLGWPEAGAVEGYDNSEANKNSGIVWSESSFKEYIEDPTGRTKMMFSNKNEQESRTCGPISNSSKMDGKKK